MEDVEICYGCRCCGLTEMYVHLIWKLDTCLTTSRAMCNSFSASPLAHTSMNDVLASEHLSRKRRLPSPVTTLAVAIIIAPESSPHPFCTEKLHPELSIVCSERAGDAIFVSGVQQ